MVRLSISLSRARTGASVLFVVSMLLLVSCAPSSPSRPSSPASQPSAPSRIMAVVSGDPPVLYSKLADPAIAGVSAIEALVNVGLSIQDQAGVARPRLAESLPSVENGLWIVSPDGTMETTWKIRSGAQWHDGIPLDADDLVFTSQVVRDPDLPAFGDPALRAIADVRPVDERTVVVSWSRPYIYADQMFGTLAMPIPRHLLESAYSDSKATFTDQPYWSHGFVGNGPFRLKDWEAGSHLVVEAFDGYLLGRPKIDEIEIRVIIDTNVLVSNVLSGEVDVSLGRNVSPEQAALLRQQWQGGRVDVGRLTLALNVWPQFVNPRPQVVSDVRFRRALYAA